MQTTRAKVEKQLPVHIRWMIRRDMAEVLQTEQDSFTLPWTEEDFLHCLRQRNCIGMVAEQGERVVGYVIYELHKTKLHILNLAVTPELRRQGVGAQMIAKLIGKLSSHRRSRITLEVRESNLVAQVFFRSIQFTATRVLRGYYEDTTEDAYVMEYCLPNACVVADDDLGGSKPINRIAQFESDDRP